MLLYGNASQAKLLGPDIFIFNFTSMIEKYARIPLIPPNSLGASSEYDFDVKYMHYILDNDRNFYIFMKCLIIPLYEGSNIFLCISEDQWSEMVIESLLKMIQQRYSCNAVRINTAEDLANIDPMDSLDFNSGYGLFNLDQDKERFAYMSEQYRLAAGYKPYSENGGF